MALLAILLIGIGLTTFRAGIKPAHRESQLRPKPEAPPDLAKLRNDFASGFEALQRGEGRDAVKHFTSFTFGGRAIEEYRLYFLANGYQLAGDRKAARTTLAALWHRTPHLVYWEDAGFNLAGLYGSVADWQHVSEVGETIGTRTETPSIAAAARWQAVEGRFYRGDLASLLDDAHKIVVRSPRAPQAASAIALIQSLTGAQPSAPLVLDPAERLERGVALLRDGDPQSAFNELTTLVPEIPAPLKDAVELNRGLALHQMRRFEDSTRVLAPLTSHGSASIAVPALYHMAKNDRIVSASINPIVFKTIVERKQIGTIKVRVKKKTVVKAKFANVSRVIQLVDLPRKVKKEELDRSATQRLKQLLTLPLADPVRIEVLNALIASAEQKNQDDYERELITQLVKIDPASDPGLQHFWEKAWAAYMRGDAATATALLTFISETYRSPNVKRQARYWYARTIERAGKKQEAQAIYQSLASAPYLDLYAMHSRNRGAVRKDNETNPLRAQRPDWNDIAEKSMPAELRLAYELTALFDMRDARLEIQKNMSRANQPYADALLCDLYNSMRNTDLLYRSLRRAFPQLATVEQDSVPAYFLKMYYPIRYEEAIRKNAQRNGLDPEILMGLILQESSFNPKARSPVGATGLMQLMPATGKELGTRLYGTFSVIRLENPDTNIAIGAVYFKHLVQLFDGKAQLAIASYNAGQGNVMKWRRAAPGKPLDEFLESIPFPETRNYVKRVTLLASSYHRLTLH